MKTQEETLDNVKNRLVKLVSVVINLNEASEINDSMKYKFYKNQQQYLKGYTDFLLEKTQRNLPSANYIRGYTDARMWLND